MSTNDLQASSDLLFCPFCGGEAEFETYGGTACAVTCRKCRCGTSTVRLDDGERTVEAWNRRAERTCHLIHEVEEEDDEFFDTVERHYYVCSECGRANRMDARYCDWCGARVIEEDS